MAKKSNSVVDELVARGVGGTAPTQAETVEQVDPEPPVEQVDPEPPFNEAPEVSVQSTHKFVNCVPAPQPGTTFQLPDGTLLRDN